MFVSDDSRVELYQRPLTPIERLFTRSPFSIVTMVVRIQGGVTENMIRDAVSQVAGRHPNLGACIVEDEQGNRWLTSEGAGAIPVECVPRQSDDHWIGLVQAACRVPFEFEARPPIRFILAQSRTTSDLVIVCHHIVCDGLSLAYLARDVMAYLGDPALGVEPLPDPQPIDSDNMPEGVGANALVRFLINRMNRRWQDEKVLFDHEDYTSLNEAYWTNYPHQVLTIELTEAQTAALVQRCRLEGVTVNSALSAAFVAAQVCVQGAQSFLSTVGVAANLRDRLPRPAGEVIGFYAGLVRLKARYDAGRGFWDNARQFHRQVQPLLTDKNLFGDLLLWCYLDPTILEAINFKRLGGLVPEGALRHEKLSRFGARDDTVLAILKRDRMDRLDRITLGTAVTNLGRLDFPHKYGTLVLDRLIMKPGAGFPLATVNLVLGAVTSAGKLSLVIECVEDNVGAGTMEEIKDRALEFLLGSV